MGICHTRWAAGVLDERPFFYGKLGVKLIYGAKQMLAAERVSSVDVDTGALVFGFVNLGI